MKKASIALIVLLSITLGGCSDAKTHSNDVESSTSSEKLQLKAELPAAVEDAFQQKFAGATNAQWERESEMEWEVEFLINGVEYSSTFDNSGKWMETEHELTFDEVPQVVKDAIQTNFPDFEVDESEFVESSKGSFYEFEIENKTGEREVSISPEGTILTNEMVTDEDNTGENDRDDDDTNEDD